MAFDINGRICTHQIAWLQIQYFKFTSSSLGTEEVGKTSSATKSHKLLNQLLNQVNTPIDIKKSMILQCQMCPVFPVPENIKRTKNYPHI